MASWFVLIEIINTMELSLSSEAASCVATEEFQSILWNRKFVTVKAVTDYHPLLNVTYF
jgi:hypothetical protein